MKPNPCPVCGKDAGYTTRMRRGVPCRGNPRKYCSVACAREGVDKPFIGPPHRWVPTSHRTLDVSAMPPSPTDGVKYYYAPTEICRRGHSAPRTLRKGKWECMRCINLQVKRQHAKAFSPDENALREVRHLVNVLRTEVNKVVAEQPEPLRPPPGRSRRVTPMSEAMLWVPKPNTSGLFPPGFDFTSLPVNEVDGVLHPKRAMFDGVPCSAGHLSPRVVETRGDGATQWVCAACRAAKKARDHGTCITLVPTPMHIAVYHESVGTHFAKWYTANFTND